MAYAQLPKSNHGDFVYRLLREDEDPYEDLIPKNEHATYSVSEHVEMGSRLDTQYISASRSHSQVKKMTKTAKKNDHNRDCTIVAIDMKYIKNYYPNIANNAFDFTNEKTRLIYLENNKQYNYVKKMKEFVFEDSVPKEAVRVVDILQDDFWSDDDDSNGDSYSENSDGRTGEDGSKDDSDSNYQNDIQNYYYSKSKYYNKYSKSNYYNNKNSKPKNNNNNSTPNYSNQYSKTKHYNANKYSESYYYDNCSKPKSYSKSSKPKYYEYNNKPSYYSKYSKYKY